MKPILTITLALGVLLASTIFYGISNKKVLANDDSLSAQQPTIEIANDQQTNTQTDKDKEPLPANTQETTDQSNHSAVATYYRAGQTTNELRRALLIELVTKLLLHMALANQVETRLADLQSVEIVYDIAGQATVAIIDSDGSRNDFVSPGNNSSDIMTKISREYSLSFRDVVALTNFVHLRQTKSLFSATDIQSASSRTVAKTTAIDITTNGVTTTYWFDTNNVLDASKNLAASYRLTHRVVWDKLLDK